MNCIIVIIPILILLLVPFYQIDGLETKKIIGQDEDSRITIEFSDKQLISYYLKFLDDDSNQIILESDNPPPKFKIRDDRFYIIDRSNGLFIIGKNIEDKKWIIISKVKIDSEKITKRWIIDIEPIKKITGQRDLLAEINQEKNTITGNSFKESQNLDMYKKINEAETIFQEKLKRLDFENNKLSKSNTVTNYSEYEEYKKTIFDRDNDNYIPTVNLKNEIGSIQLFLQYSIHVGIGKNFVYDVLITDGANNNYNSKFNAFVGNTIDDVIISSIIKTPLNSILYESDGLTNNNGLWYDSFQIPINSITTLGAYTLEVNAKKSIDGSILKDSLQKEFFVDYIYDNTRHNLKPFAILGMNQTIITSDQTKTILDNIESELKNESSKFNSTHFKSNNDDIFYIVLNNQTKYSVDSNYDELGITALPYNSTHFKNYDNVFHKLDNSGDIKTHNGTHYIFSGNYTKSEYINYPQTQFLLKDTEIVDEIGEKLVWVLDQTMNIELDGSNSYDPEKRELEYLWSIVNPENNNYQIDESLLTGSKPIIPLNANTKEVFVFELIVNDGVQDSLIPAYMNVIMYNGTLYYYDGNNYLLGD